MKFHKLPHFTRDVTGQHYRRLPSDVSLPRISERRRRLKFRLIPGLYLIAFVDLVLIGTEKVSRIRSNIREFKHDVYGRRQTAIVNSDFLFFSCNPYINHTKIK